MLHGRGCSYELARHPPSSSPFQALVPELRADICGSLSIPSTQEARRVQGSCSSGARGTRTPDLLGAIKRLRKGRSCPERPCLLAGSQQTAAAGEVQMTRIDAVSCVFGHKSKVVPNTVLSLTLRCAPHE